MSPAKTPQKGRSRPYFPTLNTSRDWVEMLTQEADEAFRTVLDMGRLAAIQGE